MDLFKAHKEHEITVTKLNEIRTRVDETNKSLSAELENLKISNERLTSRCKAVEKDLDFERQAMEKSEIECKKTQREV